MAESTLPVAKGMLDALVLRALCWAPMHGFEITAWIEQHSGRTIRIEDAVVEIQSSRSAAVGLVFPARKAGISAARTPASSNAPAAVMRLVGSVAAIP